MTIKPSGRTELTLTFPVDPKKIRAVRFPPFSELPSGARTLLTGSGEVSSFEGKTGDGLYDAVDALRRAGFLNIVAKAAATRFSNRRASPTAGRFSITCSSCGSCAAIASSPWRRRS